MNLGVAVVCGRPRRSGSRGFRLAGTGWCVDGRGAGRCGRCRVGRGRRGGDDRLVWGRIRWRRRGLGGGVGRRRCCGAGLSARAKAAGLGRSRGGLSSKIHAAVDAGGRPLAFVLTPGQAADCPQFQAVLDQIRVPGPAGPPRTRPGAVAADKAYSSKANRAYLRRRRITAVIPEKADQQANRKNKGSVGGRPLAERDTAYCAAASGRLRRVKLYSRTLDEGSEVAVSVSSEWYAPFDSAAAARRGVMLKRLQIVPCRPPCGLFE